MKSIFHSLILDSFLKIILPVKRKEEFNGKMLLSEIELPKDIKQNILEIFTKLYKIFTKMQEIRLEIIKAIERKPFTLFNEIIKRKGKGNPYICKEDIKEFIEKSKLKILKIEIPQLISYYDKDKDGKWDNIDFNELILPYEEEQNVKQEYNNKMQIQRYKTPERKMAKIRSEPSLTPLKEELKINKKYIEVPLKEREVMIDILKSQIIIYKELEEAKIDLYYSKGFDLKGCFSLIDMHNIGSLSLYEIAEFLEEHYAEVYDNSRRKSAKNTKKQVLYSLFEKYDKDKDGLLTVQEFEDMIKPINKNNIGNNEFSVEMIKSLFKLLIVSEEKYKSVRQTKRIEFIIQDFFKSYDENSGLSEKEV